MEYYTLEEIEDKYIGKIGTPERDQYEQELQEELRACHIGEAIKEARKAKNLTQEQLGALVGVQKAQISRLEKGKSITVQGDGHSPETGYGRDWRDCVVLTNKVIII